MTNRDDALGIRIDELVYENPRFGYRRITALLRLEGWQINPKRVHKIWKQKGYRVGPARKQHRTGGNSDNACNKKRAAFKNDVWAYDFIFDRLENGRPLKILAITDEYTKESIAIEVDSSITGEKVVDVLNRSVAERGLPNNIRSDNGSEFTGKTVKKWLEQTGVKGLSVEKGSPWQNGYAESFNSRFRDECLNMNQFYTIKEARVLIGAWRRNYNEKRPHSALAGLPPALFARKCQSEGICSQKSEQMNSHGNLGPSSIASRSVPEAGILSRPSPAGRCADLDIHARASGMLPLRATDEDASGGDSVKRCMAITAINAKSSHAD